MTSTGVAVAAGWLLDQALGEPPARFHPVAGFGATMLRLERRVYVPTRGVGVAFATVGATLAIGMGVVAERALGRRPALAGAVALCVAGRMLTREAAAVLALVDTGDLDAARTNLQGLVGRATADLDESAIVRAVIESVAENTVDAVVAPLCWAAVAGAPGVLAHRAVNTLDAMVGHRSERYVDFGWAAARADDVMNYLPARITAVAIAAVSPSRASRIWRVIQRDAARHPSPNGGVVEAATAAALGCRLGGVNRYGDEVEDRGTLGDGDPPTVADGRRAIRLLAAAGAVIAGVIAIVR